MLVTAVVIVGMLHQLLGSNKVRECPLGTVTKMAVARSLDGPGKILPGDRQTSGQ